MKIKKLKGLDSSALNQVLGGTGGATGGGLKDSKDCTSELASGGGTTDTYEWA